MVPFATNHRPDEWLNVDAYEFAGTLRRMFGVSPSLATRHPPTAYGKSLLMCTHGSHVCGVKLGDTKSTRKPQSCVVLTVKIQHYHMYQIATSIWCDSKLHALNMPQLLLGTSADWFAHWLMYKPSDKCAHPLRLMHTPIGKCTHPLANEHTH